MYTRTLLVCNENDIIYTNNSQNTICSGPIHDTEHPHSAQRLRLSPSWKTDRPVCPPGALWSSNPFRAP